MARFAFAGSPAGAHSKGRSVVKTAAVTAAVLFFVFLVMEGAEMDSTRIRQPLAHFSRLQQTLSGWAFSNATAAGQGADLTPDQMAELRLQREEEEAEAERLRQQGAQGGEQKPAGEEPKKEEPKPAAEELKPAAEEPKKEEPKPAAEEPKKEEPKPAGEAGKAEEEGKPKDLSAIFAGPTLDLSGLPTIWSAMIDRKEEHTWAAPAAAAAEAKARRMEL